MAKPSIQIWLNEIRSSLLQADPSLVPLFETYSAEALFGFSYISPDLKTLPSEGHILEVGAGAMILSCYLVQLGYSVSALEPIGRGFSHFSKLREAVLELAAVKGCLPHLINAPVEHLQERASFDYAFSINVMEHVEDVEEGLHKICKSMKEGAVYRFTCPNYLFPYEPHFNIPTLFNKKLTSIIFKRRIEENKYVQDPLGAWQSLNWITPVKLRQYANKNGVALEFNRRFILSTLERVNSDEQFANRRSKLMRFLVSRMVALNLHRVLAFIPLACQPSLDCRIIKVRVAANESNN